VLPTWWLALGGRVLGVAGSQRAIITYSSSAWWKVKPAAAAGLTRAARERGSFSQMPRLPAWDQACARTPGQGVQACAGGVLGCGSKAEGGGQGGSRLTCRLRSSAS